MREPWFHVAPLPPEGDTFSLDVVEARHAAGARRLAEGDRIVVFDGEGETAVAELDGSRAIHLLVGPEGGFTDAEIVSLESAGSSLAGLGAGILPIETAAVAGLSILSLLQAGPR